MNILLYLIAASPGHPDIIPWEELSPEEQEKDRKYRDAIVRIALSLPGAGRS